MLLNTLQSTGTPYNKELSNPNVSSTQVEKLCVQIDINIHNYECKRKFDFILRARKVCPKKQSFQFGCWLHHKLMWVPWPWSIIWTLNNRKFLFVYFHPKLLENIFPCNFVRYSQQPYEVYRTDTILLWNLKLTKIVFCLFISQFPLSHNLYGKWHFS